MIARDFAAWCVAGDVENALGHPFFKRGAAHDASASNYRGVYLTAIIAKVVERCVGMVFVAFLDKSGAFGRSQWLSSRDVVVETW